MSNNVQQTPWYYIWIPWREDLVLNTLCASSVWGLFVCSVLLNLGWMFWMLLGQTFETSCHRPSGGNISAWVGAGCSEISWMEDGQSENLLIWNHMGFYPYTITLLPLELSHKGAESEKLEIHNVRVLRNCKPMDHEF